MPYFAHGWPKILSTADHTDEYNAVYLHADEELVILVTEAAIQVWSGGQHRIKLAHFTREQASLEAEGLHIKAFWCNTRRSLAIVTSKNFLLYFGLHFSKDSVLPPRRLPGFLPDYKHIDIYLQHSTHLQEENVACCAVAGDGRTVVLGFSNASLQLYSWRGKLRGTFNPLAKSLEAQASLERSTSSFQPVSATRLNSSASLDSGGQLSSLGSLLVALPATHSRGEHHANRARPGILSLDYVPSVHSLVLVLSDGRCAVCRTSEAGLYPGEHIEFSHWVCGVGSGAVCARIGSASLQLAVGMSSGNVAIYRLRGGPISRSLSGDSFVQLFRTISMSDWGYSEDFTGAVADLQWSPDSQAIAVGWQRRGLGVWSSSGCRLLCSLRQSMREGSWKAGMANSQSPLQGMERPLPLESGIRLVAWGPGGYQLMVIESGKAHRLMEISMAKRLEAGHRVTIGLGLSQGAHTRRPGEVHVLQGDDRLLLITEAADVADAPQRQQTQFAFRTRNDGANAGPDLQVHHLRLPQQYLAANYPLQHAALSSDGMDVAVAGRRGLALYSRRSSRWRLFGDVTQEREMKVQALLWLSEVIVACTTNLGPVSRPGAAELVLYPRYHLDSTSILACYPLAKVPLALDALQNFLLVASAPLEVLLLRVDLRGPVTPLAKTTAAMTIVRELSILSAGHTLKEVALVEPGAIAGQEGLDVDEEPRHCLLLRADGQLSVLDMEQGSEMILGYDVDCFWVPGIVNTHQQQSPSAPLQSQLSLNHSDSTSTLDHRIAPAGINGHSERSDVENPWWTYGSRGMQVWFPSLLGQPAGVSGQGSGAGSTDPELEFDPEVYPIGISMAEVAILGMTQRMVRAASSSGASSSGSGSGGGAGGTEIAGGAGAGNGAPAGGGSDAPSHASYPCFHPTPESQPVLPCLLRRLLQKGKMDDALTLAKRHASGPHFSRSLEWLLFTSLEADADARSPTKATKYGARLQPEDNLLRAAATFIRQFPQFGDIVVSVARKTDAQLWPALFAAVGQPSSLLQELLAAGALQSAACCLLVVDRIEGSPAAVDQAHNLIEVALEGGHYDLVAELLRFLVPPSHTSSLLPDFFTAAPQPSPPRPTLPAESNYNWFLSFLWTPPTGQQSEEEQARPATQDGEAAPPGSSGSDPVQEALRIINGAAWRLLDHGLLRCLARLGQALAAVGAGLPQLMGLRVPPSPHTAPMSAMSLLSALTVALSELPVFAEPAACAEAYMLLEACQATGIQTWATVLAIMLDDTLALAKVQQENPAIWAEFAALVLGDTQFEPFWTTIRAITPEKQLDTPQAQP